MSADLYIAKIHDPLRHRYQPLFDKAVRLRDHLQARLPWVRNHPSQRQVLQELAASAQDIVSHFHDAMYRQGYFCNPYDVDCVLFRLGLSW